jgi:peptidoglycan L-alanyl-D-glutamate endopeptidase CwlK
VVKLQERLQELGFNPGKIDGVFGPITQAALLAFQKARGLKTDGIAGPRTLKALEAEPEALASEPEAAAGGVLTQVNAALVAKMFPFTPRSHIDQYLPYVLKALAEAQLTDKSMILMALATIRAETEGFEPISEGRSRFNTSPGGHPFDRYDHRRDLGNQGPPDGERFRGRGFVQLTGRDNYQKYSEALGLGDELLENPERANDPEIAAQLLAKFLADRKDQIRAALQQDNLKRARQLVNGGTHGLERFAEAYYLGQQLLA